MPNLAYIHVNPNARTGLFQPGGYSPPQSGQMQANGGLFSTQISSLSQPSMFGLGSSPKYNAGYSYTGGSGTGSNPVSTYTDSGGTNTSTSDPFTFGVGLGAAGIDPTDRYLQIITGKAPGWNNTFVNPEWGQEVGLYNAGGPKGGWSNLFNEMGFYPSLQDWYSDYLKHQQNPTANSTSPVPGLTSIRGAPSDRGISPPTRPMATPSMNTHSRWYQPVMSGNMGETGVMSGFPNIHGPPKIGMGQLMDVVNQQNQPFHH